MLNNNYLILFIYNHICCKQSISTKFYHYTILKKQLNDRSTIIQDSTDCKNVGVQCNILDAQQIIQVQEQLKVKSNEIKRLSFQLEDLKGKVKVYCRVRPSNSLDKLKDCEVQFIDEQHISLKQKLFNFDICFNQTSTQKEIYEEIQQSLQAIFHGYNLSIFAYGQTGSGKTHTMFGTKLQPGVIPNLIEDIYAYIKKNNLESQILVNSLEIYKENIIDLLNDQQNVQTLELKENANGLVFVQNLTNIRVQNMHELMNLIEYATSKRKQSQTDMNDTSSRSHMCTQLIIETFTVRLLLFITIFFQYGYKIYFVSSQQQLKFQSVIRILHKNSSAELIQLIQQDQKDATNLDLSRINQTKLNIQIKVFQLLMML